MQNYATMMISHNIQHINLTGFTSLLKHTVCGPISFLVKKVEVKVTQHRTGPPIGYTFLAQKKKQSSAKLLAICKLLIELKSFQSKE